MKSCRKILALNRPAVTRRLLTTASSNEAAASSSTTPNNNTNQQTTTPNDQELKALNEKLTKYESDLADMKDKYLRAMADAENTRFRMKKQVDDAKIFGIQGFCKDLLEVADILNLAIVNTNPEKTKVDTSSTESVMEQLQSMHKGLAMTEACLLKVFNKHNLHQIKPAQGDAFDPNFHEAVFRLKMPNEKSGSVHVLTKTGYKLNERVIRAAQVGVVE
jgi:molecular chaperone GrpE